MITFVAVAMLFIKILEATIFHGSCSSDIQQINEYFDFSYRPILIMPGNSSRNHMFRNFFGHTPECWDFVILANRNMLTELRIIFARNTEPFSYPFIERSLCNGFVHKTDRILLEIDISDKKLFFKTFKPKIFNKPLPMMCKSEHNWRSRLQVKIRRVESENTYKENYIVLWNCEDLQDGQYDLGILVGLSSRILQNATALIYERNRILETSLELVKSLPFAENFTMEDFQKAHLHDGVQCDLCEVFECN